MKICYIHQGNIFIGNYNKRDMNYYLVLNHDKESVEGRLIIHEKNVLDTYPKRISDDEIYSKHAEYLI